MKTEKETKNKENKERENKQLINKQNENIMKTNETKTAKQTSIEKLQEITKLSDLKTCLGAKKSSIYRDEIFTEMNEKEKKILRKKIRNVLLSFVKSELTEKNIQQFNNFYSAFYKVQDYTLSSVCSENLDENKKKQISEFLNKVKKQEKA